jgi:hypothetical protein
MKGIATVLIAGLVFLPIFDSKAEIYEEDDTYIGFQLSIPIGATSNHSALTKFEYGLMLVDRTDGITTGVAWIHDTGRDSDTLGYLPPSHNFLVGKSRVSEHALPMFSNGDDFDLSVGGATRFDGFDFLMYTIAGIYFVGHALKDVFDDLDEIDDEDEAPETVE